MKQIKHVLLLILLIFIPSLLHAQALDAYQGNTGVPCNGGVKPRFYPEKRTDANGVLRWFMCTPAGNSIFVAGFFNAGRDGGTDYQGITTSNLTNSKYGSGAPYNDASVNWAAASIDRFRRWGINTMYQASDPRFDPTRNGYWPAGDHYPPVGYRMNVAYQTWVSHYSRFNDRGLAFVANDALDGGNYAKGYPTSITNDFYGLGPNSSNIRMADPFDPNFKAWALASVTIDLAPSFNDPTYGSYWLGVEIDDNDSVAISKAGWDLGIVNGTTNPAYAAPNFGVITLMASPVQVAESTSDGDVDGSIIYSDTTFYAKAKMASWLQGTTDQTSSVSASRSGSTVTLVVGASHPYNWGDVLTVKSCSDTTFNSVAGTGVNVSSITATTVIYTQVGAGVSATGCVVTTGSGYTLGTLNTAWGSSYDTLGTDAAVFTAESLGTGNGATLTFAKTVAHVPATINTLQILINGVPAVGDGQGMVMFSNPSRDVALTCLTSTTYAVGKRCRDSNGNVEVVKVSGASGGSAPVWATGFGSATVDGGITWVNIIGNNLASSSWTPSTGALSVTFTTAPANTIPLTLNYSTGGWKVGHGLLDEDSSCPAKGGGNCWIVDNCTSACGTGNGPWTMTGTHVTAAFLVDMDNWQYYLAKSYFSQLLSVVRANDANILYLGTTSIGSWCSPPHRRTLQAAGEYVGPNVMTITTIPANPFGAAGITCNGGQDQVAINLMTQWAGDKAWIPWVSITANLDSYFSPYGTPGFLNVALQSTRASGFTNWMTGFLTTTDATYNTVHGVGYQWWEYMDSRGEQTNWGWVTSRDDEYDGKQATSNAGVDSSGRETGCQGRDGNASGSYYCEQSCPTSSTCNGTRVSYGNFTGPAAATNQMWLNYVTRTHTTGAVGGTTH